MNAHIAKLFSPSDCKHGLVLLAIPPLENSKGTNTLALNTLAVGKNCDFLPKSPFISETVHDRSMVATDHYREVIGCRFICVGSNESVLQRRDATDQILFWRISILRWYDL